MKKELQNKLFKKYPKIFRQKDLSMQESAMCWGIACGDGWYDLIDSLCGQIQNQVENVNRRRKYKFENSPKTLVPTSIEHFNCEAVQVKEKFGGLCFYVHGGDEYIDGLIDMTESMSYKLCSVCGNRMEENNNRSRGWVYTVCASCKEKNEK